MTDLTFAYGSNLSAEDWSSFCRARGADPAVIERVGRGFLPDRELCFSRWSARRQGGVLGLRERFGQVVDGWLYRVRSDEGWRLLDEKEGVPTAYGRRVAVVLRPRGREAVAVVYDVAEPVTWVEPAAAYLQLVRTARRRRRLDSVQLEAAAMDLAPPFLVRDLFVYGTLMRGGRLHPVLEEAGIRSVEPATVSGRRIDLGEYPGIVEAPGLVRGECVTLADPSAGLAATDAVEGFVGFGQAGNLFRRALIRCSTATGGRWAWHYRPVL